MNNLPQIHFADKYLLQPTNPITVNLIGAGGTGSQVLTCLARINHSLLTLGHAGLFVRAFDNDLITTANLGRQLFASSEIGMNKAIVLISRVNRFFGTNWKAIAKWYNQKSFQPANITISCVDTAKARFEIADILKKSCLHESEVQNKSLYWMDFGNSRTIGQVILSTIKEIKQPRSKEFIPVKYLPLITDEFKSLLEAADQNSETPSCSLAEALTKQDLFINSTLASLGASLLWNLFRDGLTANRGFFLCLKDFRTQPLPVGIKN